MLEGKREKASVLSPTLRALRSSPAGNRLFTPVCLAKMSLPSEAGTLPFRVLLVSEII